MLSAVKSNKNAVLGNTTVKSNDKGVFVYLYDTIIFAKVRGRVYYSDGGHNTRTTSRRLKALGADYSTNYEKSNCRLEDQRTMVRLMCLGKK